MDDSSKSQVNLKQLKQLGTGGADDGAIEKATERVLQALLRQREVAERMSAILDGERGAVEASRRTCKNLEAAISTSRMPGYFKYYQPPEQVSYAERKGTMKKFAKDLQDAENECVTANLALAKVKEATSRKAAEEAKRTQEQRGAGRSLKDWLRVNGRPCAPAEGMLSTVQPSGRVYGGGRHQGSFRSVAATMKHGRVTR